MRKNQIKKESKIDKLLEIPKEISTNEPRLTNMGFNKMLIENYKMILEYQDFFIRISTQIGIININGFDLKLGEMTADEDGVDLLGYTVWGCIDPVSFTTGEMRKRYGFIYVDKNDDGSGTYARIKKKSFDWYKKVISSNGEEV